MAPYAHVQKFAQLYQVELQHHYATKLTAHIQKKIDVGEEEINKYYLENQEEFKLPPLYRVIEKPSEGIENNRMESHFRNNYNVLIHIIILYLILMVF